MRENIVCLQDGFLGDLIFLLEGIEGSVVELFNKLLRYVKSCVRRYTNVEKCLLKSFYYFVFQMSIFCPPGVDNQHMFILSNIKAVCLLGRSSFGLSTCRWDNL